jgi:hypothetical protein
MSCSDARFLRRLIGTTVTTYDAAPHPTFSERSPPGQFPRLPSMSATVLEENSRTWVITEKLSERAVCMTETDVKMGRGPSITVGKFLCHRSVLYCYSYGACILTRIYFDRDEPPRLQNLESRRQR